MKKIALYDLSSINGGDPGCMNTINGMRVFGSVLSVYGVWLGPVGLLTAVTGGVIYGTALALYAGGAC